MIGKRAFEMVLYSETGLTQQMLMHASSRLTLGRRIKQPLCYDPADTWRHNRINNNFVWHLQISTLK